MATYARGSTVIFEQSFVDPTGDPFVPVDTTYPQIQIEDPQGVIVASGTGTATGTPGLWQFEYTIPADAEISRGWREVWTLSDINYHSHQTDTAFEVIPVIEETDGLDRYGVYLTMLNTSERLIWKHRVDPEIVSVTVRNLAGDVFLQRPKEELTLVVADGFYNYFTDTPVFAEVGEQLVVWRYRETTLSTFSYENQSLFVPHEVFWFLLPQLRMLIDKLNKRTDTPLSYLDVELYKAFEKGLHFINTIPPLTCWTWTSVPEVFWAWWTIAAGLWALMARQLLEIEVSHELSAQSVTLSYDHYSPLSEVLQRWEEMLKDWFQKAKVEAFRRSAGPGHVAVRPYRLTSRNRVYRAATSAQALSDFPGLMNRLGLYY